MENAQRAASWEDLQNRVKVQVETRPRGTGCIFRGPTDIDEGLYVPEDLEMLEESIRHFMDAHRAGEENYIFVGSKWDRETRFRLSPVKLFEASSIQLAADIVQLNFLGPNKALTLTEWGCPIYVAPNITMEADA